DRVQARSALLPAVSHSTQFLGNSPNGVNPNGRFVSLDGVQMYRSWAVVHQELSPNVLMLTPLRKAQAAEAAAQAKLEIARRGLAVTVTRNYYGLVVAQRKYAAGRDNPDVRAADQALRAAGQDVRAAKNAFLPGIVIDGVYGIEANEFALHSRIAAQPELGVLPNLGYFITVNLTVPVWDWGGLRSRLHQSETRQ